jgi:DNA-binding CsgD family transcriptional regulator/catechol 2,3-dioxygenase-like lactoylglutathione lyase family enzyme
VKFAAGGSNVTSMTRRGRPPASDILTPAEWRIVHAAQHGMSNAEIARRRGISKDAVRFHIRNALGKLGLERKSDLRRWFAVPANAALAREGDMEVESIGQVARTVSDIAASEAWHRDILGLTHLFTFGDLAFFDIGGTRLMLKGGAAEPESILYLKVGNIVEAHEELTGKGVAFEAPPHMIHRHENGIEEWMAFFKDPDGRILALMAQVSPGV